MFGGLADHDSVDGADPARRAAWHAALLATAAVPGCGGAMFVAWRGRDPVVSASSDPALARFGNVEFSLGAGPTLQALRSESPIEVDDLLADPRWPRLRSYALRYGARCLRAMAVPASGAGLIATLTLYGQGPRHPPEGGVAVGSCIAIEALAQLDEWWAGRPPAGGRPATGQSGHQIAQ